MRMRAYFRTLLSKGIAVDKVSIVVDTTDFDGLVCDHQSISTIASIYFGISTRTEGKRLMCPTEAGRVGGVFRGETGGGA